MTTREVRHHLLTGKHIKKPKKEGSIGIIESNVGGSKIRFVYTVRRGVVCLITVEGRLWRFAHFAIQN
jgi:hypothetical protein